jgi:HlyD family secretion protein
LRTSASLVGQAGAIESQIAGTATQLAEARQQIERLTTSRVEEAVSELNTVRSSLADLEEQINAAQSILQRTIVKASWFTHHIMSRMGLSGRVKS